MRKIALMLLVIGIGLAIAAQYQPLSKSKAESKTATGSPVQIYSHKSLAKHTSPSDATILSQDFEGGVMPPTGWTLVQQNPTYTWQISSAYLHSGTYGALSPWDYNLDEKLVSPVIDLSSYAPGTPIFLSFWWEGSYDWYVSPYNNGTFSVDVSTNGTTWTTIWDEETSYAWSSFTWYDADFGNHLNLSAYAGQSTFQFRFRNLANDNADLAIDDILLYALDIQNDVGITAIDISKPIFVGAPKAITVTIKNYGATTQYSMPVTYDPGDGSGVVNETWTDVLGLPSLGETDYSFTTTWTPPTTGHYEFTASTQLEGDEDMTNDTYADSVVVCPPYHTPPYTETFDELWGPYGNNPPFCGWTIVDNGTETPPVWNTNDWFHAELIEPSRNIAAIQYSPLEISDDWLISPIFDCSAPGQYSLGYWHLYYGYAGSQPDTGYVMLSIDDGFTWTEITRYTGGVTAIIDSGYHTFDITSLVAGQTNVKVAFRYFAQNAYYWFIDDFSLGYIPEEYPLIVSTIGNGHVDIDPVLPTYPYGSSVTLTAVADPGWTFTEWTGDLTGSTNPATIIINGPKDITATFELGTPPGWAPLDPIPNPADVKAGKHVKDGGALVGVSIFKQEDIYAFHGNKSSHFYKYADAWSELESIPYGVKPTNPLKINKKKIGKGAALCFDGAGTIYATKGNGTTEFWAYSILANTWTAKAFVPVPKALKGGTSLVYYAGKVYLLAGGQKKTDLNNFYVYDPTGDTLLGTPWTPLASLELGANTKVWKDGACLAELGGVIYALKTSDKANLFYGYDTLGNVWNPVDSMPVVESLFGKKKKVIAKDGAAMASGGGVIYAIKGGGANVFWMFNGTTWSKLESIPRADKKSVPKTGAALAYLDGVVYLLKGNNTAEYWKYDPIAKVAEVKPTTIQTVTANPTPRPSFNFSASMLSKTIRYAVPVSGKVSIKLYNATGRLVETVYNGYLNAGTYTANVSNIASGVYFVKYEDRTNCAEIKLIVE